MRTHEWENMLSDVEEKYWDYPIQTQLALAEVVRLRKAIAELEAEERATADDEFYPVHLRDLCRAYADDLARILEGEES